MKTGIHLDVPEVEYHADPAFSQSQAKVLLDSPAKYQWRLANPEPPRDVFDFGHAVHAKVLGVGLDFWKVDADDWRTKAAQQQRDAARSYGFVPMLAKDLAKADAMAEAVLDNKGARAILESEGDVEVSMWWELTGYVAGEGESADSVVACRGRVDKLATNADGLVIADLKTTQDASPRGFASSAAKFGYRLQGGAYADGIEHITGERPPVVFIAVEKEPPHLVGLYSLNEWDIDAGRVKWREAVDLLATCRHRNEWPAYSPDIQPLDLPAWAL